MQGKNFDIFISYRRSDGEPIARIITETLKGKNYRCFLDYDKLKGGKFDERIEKAIKDAPIFIAVMTPDYLVRPKEDKEKDLSEEEKENQGEDWVYKEIEIANANNKYIISINHNKKIKSIPKEVPANIAKALGAHTFAEVHDGQTYASNMEDLIKGWISEIVPPPTEKTQGKANIEVKSDANCDILKAGEVIATVAKGGYNILKLSEGTHRLVFRSNEFSDIEQEVIKEVKSNLADDIIDVNLADKVKARRIEIQRQQDAEIAKQKAEAERIKREKAEAERRERERKQRERERKQREEEARSKIAEAEQRKAERKEWWQRNESRFAIATLVITFSVIGLLIYLNWDSTLKTLKGHSDTVRSVAASPDGKYLASGSEDKTIKIWDAKSGQSLKTLKGHASDVWSVCWSPDGKYLASGSDDTTIVIWDANSGQSLKTLKGHSDYVYSVCWSPDGKYFASGSRDATVIIWDAKNGQKLKSLKGHTNTVSSVCWSPDGKYLASGSLDTTVVIWDAESGQRLKTLKGHSGSLHSVSWSPDGKYLASGVGKKFLFFPKGELVIWDAKSGERLKTLKVHYGYVYSVSWSPDGKYLASGTTNNTVIIWDAKSGESLKTLARHSQYVSSVCWSPDGKYLISGSKDKTVKIGGVE